MLAADGPAQPERPHRPILQQARLRRRPVRRRAQEHGLRTVHPLLLQPGARTARGPRRRGALHRAPVRCRHRPAGRIAVRQVEVPPRAASPLHVRLGPPPGACLHRSLLAAGGIEPVGSVLVAHGLRDPDARRHDALPRPPPRTRGGVDPELPRAQPRRRLSAVLRHGGERRGDRGGLRLLLRRRHGRPPGRGELHAVRDPARRAHGRDDLVLGPRHAKGGAISCPSRRRGRNAMRSCSSSPISWRRSGTARSPG